MTVLETIKYRTGYLDKYKNAHRFQFRCAFISLHIVFILWRRKDVLCCQVFSAR